jgi:excisionase family DNA binding protein
MVMELKTRPTPGTSRLVRTQEAALYLGISPKQLRRLVRLGDVSVIQSGNIWLFDVKALDAYVDRQQATEYPTGAGTNGFDERQGYVN